MKTYDVRAKRWEHGWELHISDVGVTQSRSLWDAEMMARDLISWRLGMPAESFGVAVTPEIARAWTSRPAPPETRSPPPISLSAGRPLSPGR